MARKDYFNPDTYMVIDRITGEELPVGIFIEKANTNGWQKAYARTIAEYIRCGDGKSVDLLAWIIENKDHNNMIYGSQRYMAKKAKVSLSIVSRTFRALKNKKMIKQVEQGQYLVSPDLMRNGNNKAGAMMLRLWGELK